MAKKVKRAWFTEIVNVDIHLAIVENTPRTLGGVTDQWQAVTEALTIRYELIVCDVDLVTVTSSYTLIPARYHKTIVDKAISIGYRDIRNKDLESAEYFNSLYERDVKKAKKYAKTRHVSTGRIVPQDF